MSDGKIPSDIDRLNSIQSGFLRTLANSFKSILVTLSYPLLSLFGKPFIKFIISVSVHWVRNTLLEFSGVLDK